MGFFDYITKIDFSILYYIQEHLRCSFLDFLMPLFGFIQEGGMVWIVISIILICFKKTTPEYLAEEVHFRSPLCFLTEFSLFYVT